VSKNYVFTAQTLIGDGVVLYRCYAVWQSKLVMILPVLLWCAAGATGIGSPYTASKVMQSEVFIGSLSRWITSFLGNGVGDKPVDDLSVGLSYLVCRPESHEAACQSPTLPTATDSTHPYRCWLNLLPRPACGVDLLCMSNQRPIRDVRHGHAYHLHHILYGHHPRRAGYTD